VKTVISVLAWTTGIVGLIICVFLLIAGTLLLTPRRFSDFTRMTMRTILFFFFVRVRVEGLERVDATVPRIFVANHASFIDFFLLGAYLPGITRGIEAGEHFSWPLWGTFLRRSGMVPIDRSSASASLRSMKAAAAKVRDGLSIIVLPEGTRTWTGRMLPFRRLPFMIAKKAKCEIIPVGLKGTFRIKNKGSWLLRPGRAAMIFGETIDAQTVAETDLKDLALLAQERVAALCGD